MDRDTSFLMIEVKTKTSVTQVDLNEDLRIDPMNISADFCEQPAKYAYWATVTAQAKSLVERKRLEVEKLEDYLKKTLVGELDGEVRRELEMNGEKITETKVVNGIFVHPKYVETQEKLYSLKEELVDLQQKFAVLDIARDAMNQRKDMLISLGAQLRVEGNNADVFIKDKAAEVVKSSRQKRNMEVD